MLSLVNVGHNYWYPIIAMSFSQDNSSECYHIMPEEFGEHLTRDQRPFLHPESLQMFRYQLHVSTSPLHPTHFLQGSGQRTGTAMVNINFVLSGFGLLSWWKIQTWPIIRFLTEVVRVWFCICWYLIESMMPCISTRCPGPPAEKTGPQH